jgi:hypothetical protein
MQYPVNERGQKLHPELGYVICGKPTKRVNRYGDKICLDAPTRGREQCRRHGGKTKRGADHWNYQAKGQSKHMPTRLAERFAAADADPRLTDLRRILATREAFVQERLADIDTAPDAAEVWQDMSRQLNALEVAYGKADATGMAQALRSMRAIISERNRYHATRAEIESALNEQRRDIDSINTEKYKSERALSEEQAALLIGAVVNLLMELKDERERNDKLRKLDALLTIDAPSLPGSPPAHNGNGRG